jgi:predicted transcriptional regulator
MAKPTSIKLDEDLRDRVQHLAEARRRSSHWIMREAITQYVEREERRETLRRDTLRAWEEFEATGLHASAEEVEKWLSSPRPPRPRGERARRSSRGVQGLGAHPRMGRLRGSAGGVPGMGDRVRGQ